MDKWLREYLIGAHKKQRKHLYRVLDGITDEMLKKEVSEEDEFPTILSILRHLVNAEMYWFYKSGNPIGTPLKEDEVVEIKRSLEENTSKILGVLANVGKADLRVQWPDEEGRPSVTWAIMRTVQHGIYHAGQIAKIRRILGAPSLPPDDEETWGQAVDSLMEIIQRFVDAAVLPP